MKDFIYKHKIAFFLAVLVGVLTFLPQFFAIHNLGEDFKGIYPIQGSDDLYYLARTHDVLDGNIKISNPYLYEHKDGISAPFWIPDNIIVVFSKIFFDGNIQYAFFALDLFLPAFLLLLTYGILYKSTERIDLSLLGSAFFHMGMHIESFGRSPSPQLNFIFFSTLFLLLVLAFQHKKRRYFVFAGLNLGFLFYVYPYYWTFYCVYIVLIALGYLFVYRDRASFLKWISVLVVGGVVAIPYIISTSRISKLPEYTETMQRLGMIDTHFPSGIFIVAISLLSLLLFFVLYRLRKIHPNALYLLLASGALASIISVNHHVITGKNLEFSSHYVHQAVFVFVVFVAYMYADIKRSIGEKKWRLGLMSLTVLVTFFCLNSVATAFYKEAIPGEQERRFQSYASLFEWLRENTEPESVVMASNEIGALIPIYTKNNVFYTDRANLHYMRDGDVEKRFLINHLNESIDRDYLIRHERFVWRTYFINRWAHEQTKKKIFSLIGVDRQQVLRLPETEIERVIALHKEIKDTEILKLLSPYRLDYIVIDSLDIFRNPLPSHMLQKVHSVDSFDVFLVKK